MVRLQDNREAAALNSRAGRGEVRATLELDVANARNVAKALEPDIKAERFTTELLPEDKKLKIIISAASIGELTAGINSCLRLVRAATAAQEVK